MNDNDFMRYSRQILLKDISIKGQQKLLESKVLIIGLGGLGAPAAAYIAGAGIGTLILADKDKIHLSNLQRQILFTTKDINKSKAKITKYRLQALNPDIKIVAIKDKLMGKELYYQIEKSDVVLDCTDNIKTRQAINSVCVLTNTPLITASAVGFNGQIMTITPPWKYGCYQCLWSDVNDYELYYNCRTAGIIGPVVGIMGTLQALEAITFLVGIKNKNNKLQLFNALSGKWIQLLLKKSANCGVCRGQNVDFT